jgi:hypothetical protein
MKILLVGLAALLLSLPLLAQKTATQPVRVAVVVPRDYPAYMDFNLARDEVDRWVRLTQEWFVREVGLTFDYELVLHYSGRTIYDMACATTSGGTTNCALDGCTEAPIPEGQGLMWSNLWSAVADELGWPPFPEHGRYWAVVIGAGGWAGGQYTGGRQDFGRLIVGDWGLHQLLGTVDACNPYGWDPEPGRAFGHEILHTMNVPCHLEDLRDPAGCGGFLSDPLCSEQKRALKRYNKAFLRPL